MHTRPNSIMEHAMGVEKYYALVKAFCVEPGYLDRACDLATGAFDKSAREG